MITLDLSGDLKPLKNALRRFRREQLPFATTMALTKLAQGVSAEETKAVRETFDNPTPFTQKGFRITPATKSRQVAYVAAKNIAAQYLAPYVFGGERSLGSKKGMLVPRGVATNQYGNLSRNKLSSLKGKPNVFIGPVKAKDGRIINGVWQRPSAALPTKGRRQGRRGAGVPPPKVQSGLKLLIQFEDTSEAPEHFPFFERATTYLRKHAIEEFTAALELALATARR